MLLQPLPASHKDHALLLHRFFDIRVGGFAVELRLHSGQESALLLRNAQPLEGAFHVIRHLVPRALRLRALGEIVAEIIKVNVLEILARPVGRQRFLLKDFQSLLTEFADPVRILLRVTNVVDGLLRQPGARVKGVVLGVREVSDVLVDCQIRLFFDFDFAHGFLPQAATRSFSTQS